MRQLTTGCEWVVLFVCFFHFLFISGSDKQLVFYRTHTSEQTDIAPLEHEVKNHWMPTVCKECNPDKHCTGEGGTHRVAQGV